MPAATATKPYVIALEEHYADPAVLARTEGGGRGGRMGALLDRLTDLGDVRLGEMDAAGIDFQVLSHAPSAIQQLDGTESRQLARDANDRLHDAVDRNPERFAAFAALPTTDPQAAADELERTVSQLGFKGAMIHGRSRGEEFHDLRKFWPIYERAQHLDVPIYIHPGPPHPAMAAAYYNDYLQDHPFLSSAAWGFTIDTATQVVRMILSGLFDAYPRLKVIVGHLGEGIPYLVDRIDESLNRPGGKPIAFKSIFSNHFWVTTSGHFSTPALMCALMEMGIDRILFSVDWPYVENQPGMDWMQTIPLSAEDREKMLNGNARRLLKL
ncbi:MAG: amidohydrolase [Chloroflexi bacterium]|nr:amidohydrolase [Chloroflexota bacterium]